MDKENDSDDEGMLDRVWKTITDRDSKSFGMHRKGMEGLSWWRMKELMLVMKLRGRSRRKTLWDLPLPTWLQTWEPKYIGLDISSF